MSREQLGWKEPPAHLAPWQAVEDRSLLALEPPVHTRLRGLVNRAFVSRAIERLAAPIAKLAESHVAAMRREGQTDLIAAFATPIPVIVIADLLGAPAAMADQFLDWSHRMVAMYQFGVTREVEDSAAAAAADFSAYLRGLVAERRKAPREDLISVLIAASGDAGKLDEDELIATCILLLNAGHEATVHTIGNGVRAILEAGVDGLAASGTPEGAAKLVEEVLRFDAPLHMFTRFALEPTTIGDISLKQGDVIGLHARRRQSRSRALCRGAALRPRPRRQSARLVRRRHPLLHRRAAGADGNADRAADPVCRPARAALGGRAGHARRLPFSWAGAAGGGVGGVTSA